MVGGAHQEKPLSLFYSSSHHDEVLRGKLEAHLSFLRRSKLISEWHDRMIGAGDGSGNGRQVRGRCPREWIAEPH